MSSPQLAAPQLVAWVFLPGSAATGAKPSQIYGMSANKTANPGQWLALLDDAASLTDGTIMIMYGPGVPSDSDSGVIASIGDNGVGAMEITIRSIDAGAADNTQPLSLFFYRMPRRT